MGLLSGITGKRVTAGSGPGRRDFERLLGEGERVLAAYQLVRDAFLFTDRRLILIDKQGVTGRKVSSTTRCRTGPSRTSAWRPPGTFDLDASSDLDLGTAEPIGASSARAPTSTRPGAARPVRGPMTTSTTAGDRPATWLAIPAEHPFGVQTLPYGASCCPTGRASASPSATTSWT
jgi:hypothetical protein